MRSILARSFLLMERPAGAAASSSLSLSSLAAAAGAAGLAAAGAGAATLPRFFRYGVICAERRHSQRMGVKQSKAIEVRFARASLTKDAGFWIIFLILGSSMGLSSSSRSRSFLSVQSS